MRVVAMDRLALWCLSGALRGSMPTLITLACTLVQSSIGCKLCNVPPFDVHDLQMRNTQDPHSCNLQLESWVRAAPSHVCNGGWMVFR
mmetsp:Transcript_18585/g.41552  ORF Transcript_18585/g.41552 Transcript_18585/m.41552 type:complete len:88 (-) Transcript_18585:492-755(-)